jgi:hypothetical protein
MRIQDPALADIALEAMSAPARPFSSASLCSVLAVVACLRPPLIVHCPPGVPEVIKSRGEKNVPS